MSALLLLLYMGPLEVRAVCESCVMNGPNFPSEQPQWLESAKKARDATLNSIGYKGGVFDTPQLEWTQTAYIQPQMHPYDRMFYDVDTHNYTVQRFLDDLKVRYGGVDAILLWPTYTNIGIDDRNQFDYFRTMPGGLAGVARVTHELHQSGVKVLWPYNPWDTGTRREPKSDQDTFAELLKQTGGDGFNGDTMGFIPQSFWRAAAAVGYPIALEPEGGGSDEALNWSTMGWGYWDYPLVTQVDRFKFLTRGKFMTNVCDRWSKNKTDNLQSAWLNGCGYESWENVWGTWNGIVPQDAEAIRRVGHMLRFFGGTGSAYDLLHSELWEPHVWGPLNEAVFASKFPGKAGLHVNLWTIVNRNGRNATGQQLWLVPESLNSHVYDCYHGTELKLQDVIPPAPSPPQPKEYVWFQGRNSYSGHGGTEIDVNPVPNMDPFTCTARCSADSDQCSCVTFEPSTGNCWMRANCEPAGFQTDARYDVYLVAKGYSLYPSSNCYLGHGGTVIDELPVPGLSVGQCKERCDEDPACSCVTYEPSNQQCWKRGLCTPNAFESSSEFEVYVNEARIPTGGGPVPIPSNAKAVEFEFEVNGYGCVLEIPGAADLQLASFLAEMAQMTKTALSYYSKEWNYLPQQLVSIAPTNVPKSAPVGTRRHPSAPVGTKLVPAANFVFEVAGVEIEGDDGHGVDIQYPWESHPQRTHKQNLQVGPFYMDIFPVTTTNYSEFLTETGYRPFESYLWLKNWNLTSQLQQPVPPASIADMPVTWVGLNEARMYCKWKGGRLPHEWEWQYAAQGTDGRLYPWGNTKDNTRLPPFNHGNNYPGPEPVNKFWPADASPFGISGLVGNVWQYTDEVQDRHTRSVILRGGSNYRPDGSSWYFPQALELNLHEKYFLMDDVYERAGTIGFRCVVDA